MRESQGDKHFGFGQLWCPQKLILLLLRWICMLVARCMIGISSANLVRKITKTNGCRCQHSLHPPSQAWHHYHHSYHIYLHQALYSHHSPHPTCQAPSRSYIAGATFMHERNSQIAILSLCQVIFNHYHCPVTCRLAMIPFYHSKIKYSNIPLS